MRPAEILPIGVPQAVQRVRSVRRTAGPHSQARPAAARLLDHHPRAERRAIRARAVDVATGVDLASVETTSARHETQSLVDHLRERTCLRDQVGGLGHVVAVGRRSRDRARGDVEHEVVSLRRSAGLAHLLGEEGREIELRAVASRGTVPAWSWPMPGSRSSCTRDRKGRRPSRTVRRSSRPRRCHDRPRESRSSFPAHSTRCRRGHAAQTERSSRPRPNGPRPSSRSRAPATPRSAR